MVSLSSRSLFLHHLLGLYWQTIKRHPDPGGLPEDGSPSRPSTGGRRSSWGSVCFGGIAHVAIGTPNPRSKRNHVIHWSNLPPSIVCTVMDAHTGPDPERVPRLRKRIEPFRLISPISFYRKGSILPIIRDDYCAVASAPGATMIRRYAAPRPRRTVQSSPSTVAAPAIRGCTPWALAEPARHPAQYMRPPAPATRPTDGL